MNSLQQSADLITKASKSNLAFAFKFLPRERKQDFIHFYAFCRIIDDIADHPTLESSEKFRQLKYWKRGLLYGFKKSKPLENAVTKLKEKYNIPQKLFIDLIQGCEMDLTPQRYENWEELQHYTYRVASAVGLISLYLFGACPHKSREYAITLGHALQLTNILRDIGEDVDNNNRIYLPLSELKKFGYSEDDLSNKVYNKNFIDLMAHMCSQAHQLYQQVNTLLPASEATALKAAEIMKQIYFALLRKIEKKNYQVFQKRISISKAHKVFLLTKGYYL